MKIKEAAELMHPTRHLDRDCWTEATHKPGLAIIRFLHHSQDPRLQNHEFDAGPQHPVLSTCTMRACGNTAGCVDVAISADLVFNKA